jgi:polyhydroxybutyrate depolymerase
MPVPRATPAGLERRRIVVGEIERTYRLAAPPLSPAPLLVALHGFGTDGQGLAQWSGLAERGPAAGFATVFPDGIDEVWADAAWLADAPSRRGVDDVAFLGAIAGALSAEGVARRTDPYLVGLSNGASFAEHVARLGQLRLSGVALVAASARAASRTACPRPSRAVPALFLVGTADPVAPYDGGPPRGVMASLARRRVRRRFGEPRWGPLVAVEEVVADWVAGNGCSPDPIVDEMAVPTGAPAVTRLSWSGPDAPGVTLYRIEGGGHGWPGGPQYAPAFLVGRISRGLDATGIVLEAARQAAGLDEPVRRAARAFVVDADRRVLLFEGGDPAAPELGTWWFTPGGGVEDDEDEETAVRRELFEEIGLAVDAVGPVVHRRHTAFDLFGRHFEQDDAFFVVGVGRHAVDESRQTELERELVFGHRWWSEHELMETTEVVHPTDLLSVLRRVGVFGDAPAP